MEFTVLKVYRDQPDPDITMVGDKPLSTLKKEELIDVAGRQGIDLLELCRIGGIDPRTENLVVLTQHSINERKKTGSKRPAEKGSEPEVKKSKTQDVSKSYDALIGKIGELERQLNEKRENDERQEFERLKRETKEAALGEVKPDELFAKLILLDNMARAVKDTHREQISMLISRFQAHREQPRFAAALVVKLLSSKEEEIVLDKEQKMLKSYGLGLNERQEGYKQSRAGGAYPGQNWPGFPFPTGPFTSPPRGVFGGQRPYRPRMRTQTKLICFRCHMPGHMVKDCPQVKNSKLLAVN